MTTRRSGKGRNGASWGWWTRSLAHPRLLSKPFVLDATDRAIGAGKENRHGAEVLRFSFVPSRDLASRFRASDHDSSHPGLLRWERLRVASILAGYESRLTAARQSRGKCKNIIGAIRKSGKMCPADVRGNQAELLCLPRYFALQRRSCSALCITMYLSALSSND